MNNLLQTIKTRRSVRAYRDEPIPRELLEQVVEAGLYAPSAKNTQCWQFTVVQGKDALAGLHHAVAQAIEQPDYHHFYNAPVMILVSAPRDYPHAMADCSCALENIFLAAHALGLGSVWINQFRNVCDQPTLRAQLNQLGVPENHVVCGCAAMGYAAEEPASDRKNLGIVVYA